MAGRGRGNGRGRGRMNVGSERVTRARSRREQIEIPELSSEDSSYDPSELSEGSIDVSLTDSDRVIAEAEIESDDRDVETPVRELEVGSGSGGNAPANATIDLHQFFNQMGEHMDRHLSRLSEHNRELLLNVANREVVQKGPSETDSMDNRVFKVLRELGGFPDITFKGYQDPAIAEELLLRCNSISIHWVLQMLYLRQR